MGSWCRCNAKFHCLKSITKLQPLIQLEDIYYLYTSVLILAIMKTLQQPLGSICEGSVVGSMVYFCHYTLKNT